MFFLWRNLLNACFPRNVGGTPILGPYFVATLWIFKLTYGNISQYLIKNIVLDSISSYPFAEIWEKIGVFKLKKLSHTMWYFICVSFAIIIYGFST